MCASSASVVLPKVPTFLLATALQRKLTFGALDFSPLRHSPLSRNENIIPQNRLRWSSEILKSRGCGGGVSAACTFCRKAVAATNDGRSEAQRPESRLAPESTFAGPE